MQSGSFFHMRNNQEKNAILFQQSHLTTLSRRNKENSPDHANLLRRGISPPKPGPNFDGAMMISGFASPPAKPLLPVIPIKKQEPIVLECEILPSVRV